MRQQKPVAIGNRHQDLGESGVHAFGHQCASLVKHVIQVGGFKRHDRVLDHQLVLPVQPGLGFPECGTNGLVRGQLLHQ
ncbi:hypothetical protein D3C73_1247450 [compost metagenome]